MNPFSWDDDDESDRSPDLQQTFSEISPVTFRAFLFVSLFLQVGLFAGSLGLMLIVFRRQWTLGTKLVGCGLSAFVIAVIIYRRHDAAA